MGSESISSVLVVMPTLGRRLGWLRDAVASVLAQRTSVAVVVRLVAPSSASLDEFDGRPGVEVVRSDRRGLAAAINTGWADRSRFDGLAWLGDDDLLAPGSVHAAVRGLERSGAAAVYGNVRYIDAAGRTLWLQRPTALAAPYLRWGKNLVPQQGSLFRRSAIDESGALDETLASAMDQELFTRLHRQGGIKCIATELAAFRLHDSNITVEKGAVGDDESERVRSLSGSSLYPRVRPLTQVVDRFVYAAIRRAPAPPPPRWPGGVSYVALAALAGPAPSGGPAPAR